MTRAGSALVVLCLDHDGMSSKRERARHAARVPDTLFDLIERMVRHTALDEPSEGAATG